MRIMGFIAVVILCGCASGLKSTTAARDTAGYREAKGMIRGDAIAAFRTQLTKGKLVFYAMCEHFEKEKYTFPGLLQQEVDEFISEKKVPIEVKFEDVAPVIVGAQYTGEEYWLAVDDFLSDYNRLVLAELKRRKLVQNYTAEPSSPMRVDSP